MSLPSGLLLDLSQVESVSPTVGDPSYRRFKVSLRSGRELEIYESRDDMPGSHMIRHVFIQKLLQAFPPTS